MPAVRWAIAGTCRLGFPPRALPATTAPSRNFSSGGNAVASDLSPLATGARVRESAQMAAARSAWDWPSEWISRPAPAGSVLAKCFVDSWSCLWINPSGPGNQAVIVFGQLPMRMRHSRATRPGSAVCLREVDIRETWYPTKEQEGFRRYRVNSVHSTMRTVFLFCPMAAFVLMFIVRLETQCVLRGRRVL